MTEAMKRALSGSVQKWSVYRIRNVEHAARDRLVSCQLLLHLRPQLGRGAKRIAHLVQHLTHAHHKMQCTLQRQTARAHRCGILTCAVADPWPVAERRTSTTCVPRSSDAVSLSAEQVIEKLPEYVHSNGANVDPASDAAKATPDSSASVPGVG